MIAVLFEAWPTEGKADAYFDIAAALRPELEKVDGFISVERFRSLTETGKFLSLSFWRDEAAIAHWRNTGQHRTAQQAGRNAIFDDYRLRIASVHRDYGMDDRSQAPADSRTAHGA